MAYAGALLLGASSARAQNCQVLRYTFQPDCFRDSSGGSCTQSITHLDLGPQIAVWIESADGTQFIDTLMVTNLVASRGIGNRPGLWNFVSAPKFPYGKRQMALPIWAHARGKLYDTVVMQEEANEGWLGFNEAYSSPEQFFCRPLMPSDLTIVKPTPTTFCPSGWSSCLTATSSANDSVVDTVTCPTKFNSSKGKLDPTLPQQYYPPRNDLGTDRSTFIAQDCETTGDLVATCTIDALGYSALNDLDAVAAATPPYGQVYSGIWNIPANLTAGDYAVWVEVNKEFDNNPSDPNSVHPSVGDQHGGLAGYGLPGNFGQPSVVYKVPIRIDGPNAATGAVTNIEGYSSWMGDSGTVIPRDSTISSIPGSGEGRLLSITGPAGTGRVQVSLEQCAPVVCDPPPPAPTMVGSLQVASQDLTATTADVRFTQANANGAEVTGYEIRYGATAATTMTAEEFSQATVAPQVQPAGPGTSAAVLLGSLKPSTHYVVGVRSDGPCMGVSDIAFTDFTTPAMKFTQLSGCFIATAAYGSDMQHEVAALRAVRDQLRPRNALFAAATDLYYRSGPAAAAVLRRSETARALARRLIGPLAGLAEVTSQLVTSQR